MLIRQHTHGICWIFLRVTSVIAVMLVATVSHAQVTATFIPTGPDDWEDASNWNNPNGAFVPSGEFNELAEVGNGTAIVNSAISMPGAVTVNGTGTVQVQSGFDLSTRLDGGSNGALNVSGGGTLNLIGSATVGSSTLTNATFAGRYDYDVTSASTFGTAPIRASGAVTLGGSLEVDFSGGASFGTGDNLSLVTGNTVEGNFDEVVVTGNTGGVSDGLVFDVFITSGGNGQVAQLGLSEVLVLDVNRNTGSVAIRNPHGSAAILDGYRINSAGGNLNPAGWSSIAPASGFVEAVASSTDLGELNTSSSLSLSGTQALGSAYSINPTLPLGTTADDLVFTYTSPNGGVVEGQVIYTGDLFTNDLLLRVDPSTGAAQLVNDSFQAINIDSYSIVSASGDLQPGAWQSLEMQSVSDWEEANPTSSDLSEINPTASTVLGPNTGFNLGNIWSTSGTQALVLEYLVAGEFTPRQGSVVFGSLASIVQPSGLPGDFNGDGSVNLADYTVWRNNLGSATEAALNGNGNNDNGIDVADYQLWRSAFGLNSPLSSSTAAVSAVPEPVTLPMLVFTIGACFLHRRFRRDQGRSQFAPL